MLTFLNLAQLVLYIALMALSASSCSACWPARRDTNFFYQLLQVLTDPFVEPRAITPGDRWTATCRWWPSLLAGLRAGLFDRPSCACRSGVAGSAPRPPRLLAPEAARDRAGWCSAATRPRGRASTTCCAVAARRLCAGQPRPPARPARRGATPRHRRRAGAGAAHPSAAPPTGSTWPSCSSRPAAGRGRAAFRRAVALDPKLDRAWYGLGLMLIRLRRYDEAVPRSSATPNCNR